MLKDFSNWKEYTGNSEGSGRSEKIWLEDNNKRGVFKFPKVKTDKYGNIIEISTEYIAEKLSSISDNSIYYNISMIEESITSVINPVPFEFYQMLIFEKFK